VALCCEWVDPFGNLVIEVVMCCELLKLKPLSPLYLLLLLSMPFLMLMLLIFHLLMGLFLSFLVAITASPF
jgi:hypothetical protein